jgi:hypothetical protein
MAHNQRVPYIGKSFPDMFIRYRYGGGRGYLRHRKCFWQEERLFIKMVTKSLHDL